MSAAPFEVGAEVTVSLSGDWEHLRGVPLRVASILRASTYAGGFAVRLASVPGLRVPGKAVGSAYVVPVPAKSGPISVAIAKPHGSVDDRSHIADLERSVLSLTARCDELERALERLVGTIGRTIAAVQARPFGDSYAVHSAGLNAGPPQPGSSGQAIAAPDPLHGFDDLVAEILSRRGCTLEHVRSAARVGYVCRARDEVAYALRQSDPKRWSYPEIGRLINRDHTTVMACVERHRERVCGNEAA